MKRPIHIIYNLFILTLLLVASSSKIFTQVTTVTFNYTGAFQTWVVPLCVTSIQVDVRGAEGGGTNGGNGAKVTHPSIAVTPGQVLRIYVGGSGTQPNAGWNGGGIGWTGMVASGGGGGASDIRVSPYALANRIIVAAGGGGAGGGSPNQVAGGAGGCTNGINGTGSIYTITGGVGGSQVAGGNGGPPWGAGQPGQSGSLGQGGNAGHDSNFGASGGGGGGGYYGGGGGGGDNCCIGANGGGGGGGGSSFTPAGGICTQNSNNGAGIVTITFTPGLPPVAAGNTGPFCEGATINLTSSAGGTDYDWTGPNGYVQNNTQNPTINGASLAMSGVYTVVVTGTPGCSATATTTVVVNPNPVPTASNTGPYCSGNSIQLNSPAGSATDDWAGPGYMQSDVQNPVINNATTGMTGTYTVTVTNGFACSATATTNVTVNPLPAAVAGNTGPYCEGYTVNITSNGGTDYDWTGPGGFALNNTQNTTIPGAIMGMNGIYTVTVTDMNNCSSTATTSMVVNLLPVPTANNTGPYCEGVPINLSSSGGSSYSWAGPGSYGSMVQNPAIGTSTVAMSGAYTVTATSSAGCSSTTSTIVVVTALPIPTASNTGPYCEGQVVELRSTGGVDYSWTGPLGYTSLAQNPDIHGTITGNTGTYTVVVTDGAGCSATATTLTIVYAHPTAVPLFNPQNPTTLSPEVNFYNSSYANIVSYLWNIGDVTTSTNTSFMYEFLEPGTYDSYLMVTNQWGCTDTTNFTVVVEAETSTYIPNSFTPNGDGLNEIFYVYGENWSRMELIIFDRWGSEVFYSTDPAKGWTGNKNNGDAMMEGTYTYKVYIIDFYGKERTIMGHINLLR